MRVTVDIVVGGLRGWEMHLRCPCGSIHSVEMEGLVRDRVGNGNMPVRIRADVHFKEVASARVTNDYRRCGAGQLNGS